MNRARWIAPGVAAALVLAGCGGTHHATHTTRAPATHAAKLPARAKVIFASDASATKSGKVLGDLPAGQQVASLGFDPSVDGFSFENYGFIAGTDLDAHVLRELFGDGVCAGTASDNCTLTYAAQNWASQMDSGMLGGHCLGFSTTALRLFTHNLLASEFGGTTTYSLSLTPDLQSEIAAGWATQALPDVQQAELVGTPTQTVQFLEQAFSNRKDVYTIGIHNGNEGHAVTPIGIEDTGSGNYAIEIYDNNFPGQTRAILVDTSTDTWSYQASANPNDQASEFTGQGSSNPMVLIPLSSQVKLHPCPFCTTGATLPHRRTLGVSLGGNPDAHGHLLIKSAKGEIGYVDGRFVNTIPGARVVIPFLDQDFKAHPEPLYEIPDAGPLQITLSGAGATGRDPATVRVTGPGFGASVVGLVPSAQTLDHITVGAGGSSLSLSVAGAQSTRPTVQLARQQGQAGSLATATPSALSRGAGLKLALASATSAAKVTTLGTGGSAPVQVAVQHTTASGQQSTTRKTGTVGTGATLTLGLGRIG